MKATGIIRRIDDLGRVVIPKEIRRTLKIHEGDPLEIFTDDEGGVVFRKYKAYEEINFDAVYAAMRTCRLQGIIVDLDGMRVAGKVISGLDIPNNLRDVRSPVSMTDNPDYLMYPIIHDGDLYAVAIVNRKATPHALELISAIIAMAIATIKD